MNKSEDQHTRENIHHQKWASAELNNALLWKESFTGPCALEAKWFLPKIQPLAGKRILDCGGGLGEATLFFASMGALVTYSDLSPDMVSIARNRAKDLGLDNSIIWHNGPAEELNQTELFDVFYAANLIHHLAPENREGFLIQARNLLKADGTFVSWDPISYNPVINTYRARAKEVRSVDEKPLNIGDLRMLRKIFPDNQTQFCWLLALSLMVKYALINRIDPNKVRYWKLIYKETDDALFWWKPLAKLDSYLGRVPGIRWLAWNLCFIGKK
ncbi:MAG: class I SAM-dependent methyltransferase [Verrucomicrobiota bacterium]|nr:class I SAM-dependent methyltransferase [Verrucomicrobiota bacterium]